MFNAGFGFDLDASYYISVFGLNLMYVLFMFWIGVFDACFYDLQHPCVEVFEGV